MEDFLLLLYDSGFRWPVLPELTHRSALRPQEEAGVGTIDVLDPTLRPGTSSGMLQILLYVLAIIGPIALAVWIYWTDVSACGKWYGRVKCYFVGPNEPFQFLKDSTKGSVLYGASL